MSDKEKLREEADMAYRIYYALYMSDTPYSEIKGAADRWKAVERKVRDAETLSAKPVH